MIAHLHRVDGREPIENEETKEKHPTRPDHDLTPENYYGNKSDEDPFPDTDIMDAN